MTNEQAARVLIKAVNRIGGEHDDIDEALQIAIYALSYASGNGIQFAESDKNTRIEEKNTCPHDYEEVIVPSGRVLQCRLCGDKKVYYKSDCEGKWGGECK